MNFRPACIADNAWTCIQMARAGMGIAIVPESFAIDHPELAVYSIRDDMMKSQLMLVRRDDHFMSHVTKRFFEKFEV